MGKKRVVKKKTTTARKDAIQSKGKIPRISIGRVYINSSYNNTMVSITDSKGNVVTSSSAGKIGFRGPKKATPYAATKVVESLKEHIHRMGLKEVEVYVRGIGSGRESAIRALPNQGLSIVKMVDRTPVPHNGPRARKPRRV